MDRRRLFTSACCSLLVWLARPLDADYQAGLDAYMTGDYDTAIREWQQVVESPPGIVPPAVRAETLYAIGMLFWMGMGVEQDIYESASWLVLAAEMNHVAAQNKLGYLYSTGQGVKQSDYEAFKWWQMAANQGDADAQYNLGVIYRDGLGMKPSPEESMKWFREAASNGDPISAGIVSQSDSDLNVEPLSEVSPPSAAAGDRTVSAPDEYAADRTWIAERDPQHFTIQVIALSKPENLHRFMAEQPGLEPMAIYRQTRYEKPLWVLVQGDYPNVESARLALRAFPETMQTRDKLWIRRFEMIQRLLE